MMVAVVALIAHQENLNWRQARILANRAQQENSQIALDRKSAICARWENLMTTRAKQLANSALEVQLAWEGRNAQIAR